MLELRFTAKFKKDYKWVKRQSKGLSKLEWTLEMLMREEALPDATRDHSLDATCHGLASAASSLTGCFIYPVDEEGLVLIATSMGNHGELLGL